MPTIEFESSRAGRGRVLEAPEGGALVDLCDRHLAPIPFSCRSATCGTCHIEVVEGAELLDPPESAEAELLSLLRGPPTGRLACQAVVRPVAGRLRVRPLDE